jgi:hypothetical protein
MFHPLQLGWPSITNDQSRMEEGAWCIAVLTFSRGRKKTLKVGIRGGVAAKGASGFIGNKSDLVCVVADASSITWTASPNGILAAVVVSRIFVSLGLLTAIGIGDFSCAQRG